MNLPKALTEVPNWDEPKFENPLAVSADSDGDGVYDPWDCQPFNPAEQGRFDENVRSFTRSTGQPSVGGTQRYTRWSMSPSQRRQQQQRNRDMRLAKQKQRQQQQTQQQTPQQTQQRDRRHHIRFAFQRTV